MHHEFWMWASGIVAGVCFVIVHFTKLAIKLSEGHEWLTKLFATLLRDRKKAAYLQFAANTFVFVSFSSSYLDNRGTISLIGTMMPIVIGTITFWQVFVKKAA